VLLVVAGATLDPLVAWAERKQPVRIGVLTDSWGPTPATVGLRDGLQALGYREGEQFDIGVRFTQGDVAALPAAARDLVTAGSDVIFATSANAARAAQQATTVTPIVFAEVVGDPVKLGLVRSFARPGGNITGVSTLAIELNPKRLEIFKELVPGLKRVGARGGRHRVLQRAHLEGGPGAPAQAMTPTGGYLRLPAVSPPTR